MKNLIKKIGVAVGIGSVLMFGHCRPFNAIAIEKPTPADNYYSWYSPEIASHIQDMIINNEYSKHLDFDGDNYITVADMVCVLQRYNYNIKYGNSITLDREFINAVDEENTLDIIYWEIDFADNTVCRKYSYTSNKIETVHVYYETADGESNNGLYIELNPFEETLTVKN